MLRLLPSAAARFRRWWDLRLGVRLASWLPVLLLLLAMSTVYLFGGGWGRLDRPYAPHTAKNMATAENLAPSHNFLMFYSQLAGPDGATSYHPYNRFPMGGFALIKLVILPFGDNLSAKLYAARMLMLLMFAGAAALAYLSLRRITSRRWIALAATLWAFSGYYVLYHSDTVSNEIMMDLFAVLLVFHGMTVFVQEGRYGQLLAKTGLALLLGWHVYALLLPFIVIGLGGESIRVLRGNIPGNTVIARIKSVAAALLRSRYLRLGAVALVFGLALLSFNFANEYAALGGETPLSELPSVRSMLKRVAGQNAGFNADRAEFLAWGPFLSEQFERIGRMSLPYALTVPWGGRLQEPPAGAPSLVYRAVGVAATGACLLGLLLLRRHRMPLAALALAGLCWGIGIRFSTAFHNFESVFYVGIPLALLMLILMRQRRLAVAALAVAALAIFALSSYQIGRTDARIPAQMHGTSATLMSDFQEIRGITRGKRVYVHFYEIGPHIIGLHMGNPDRIIWYYLAGSIMQLGERPISDCGPQCEQYYDFVISSNRNLYPETHLLTPSNQEAFLFNTAAINTDAITAEYRQVYDALTSGAYGAPTVQAKYDLFITNGKLIYYKSWCNATDTAHKFFLHTTPDDRNDLPDERKEYGFDNLDFGFIWRGARFDGNCIAIAPLPDYPIASIRTGQYISALGQEIWSAAISLKNPSEYNAATTAITAGDYGAPAGRGVFDVYLGETALIYYKHPCDAGDTTARFFLHFVPGDYSDLSPERQWRGFDNRDFSFAERGVVTGGRCVALAPLPDYAVARVRTGQYVSGEGRIWAVEFAGGR